MKKILIAILIILCLTGCKTSETKKEEERTLVENTSWIAKDNSEIIFKENTVKWYQSKYDHDDNYYSGTYEFYIGDEAVKFITTELKQYGVTEDELNTIFKQSNKYSKETFVVFNLVYESLTMNGETITPQTALAPWYGFILEDNTYLDVANMNTGSYYGFKLNYRINY